jgi:hypothetical protein
VLPLRPRDKRPLLPWEPLQRLPPKEAEIGEWFERWPEANIGIVTGAVSGLVVIDIDSQHEGEESLRQLEVEHGPLPHTVEAITGGGGRHFYFAHAGGLVRNRTGLASGVDLRGDGGYVVAPPSVHPSGGTYAWEVSHHPDDVPLAAIPRWLARQLADGSPRLGHPLAHWRRLARDGVAEGERNATLASFAGHLLWHGVDHEVALELLACWNAERCRPPLPHDELVRVIESIARLQARERGG